MAKITDEVMQGLVTTGLVVFGWLAFQGLIGITGADQLTDVMKLIIGIGGGILVARLGIKR